MEAKEAELERAQAAYKALSKIPKVSGWRLSLVRERVRMLKKAVKAMQAGYVPIPRFDANDLTIDYTELPSGALVALAEAERAKVFDTIRFVAGREDNGARGWRRQRGRDPLLVGVIRTPGHQIMLPNGFQQHLPAREEHFLVAWWQPWDERDGDMF